MAPWSSSSLRGFDVAGSRHRQQRGLSVGIGRVGVRAGFEQHLQHVGVADFGGEAHRRRAVVVGERHVGAGAQQPLGLGDVAVVDRPLQRRAAVGIATVDVLGPTATERLRGWAGLPGSHLRGRDRRRGQRDRERLAGADRTAPRSGQQSARPAPEPRIATALHDHTSEKAPVLSANFSIVLQPARPRGAAS